MTIECVKSIYYDAAYIDRLKNIHHHKNCCKTFHLLMGTWFFIPSVYHKNINIYFNNEIKNNIQMLQKYDIYSE